jgi:hypothetical protein
LLRIFLLLLVALLVVGQTSNGSRAADIQESTKKPFAVTPAPPAVLTTFRQFFAYVSKSEPSIVKDESAQSKWLTKSLRDGLKQKVNGFKDQPDNPDFPSNRTFVGAWDGPTTFTILGSRRYDRRVVIDVYFEWGKKTNYEGDSRLSYFIFQLEDGAWKLDDVYTFNGAFAQAESLNSYLWGKKN